MKILRRAGIVLAVLVVIRLVAGCFNPALNINDVTTGATPEYPELQPQGFTADVPAVFNAAAAVAHAEGWEVTREDRDAAVIEAVAITPLMRFKDDVTVTITRDGEQTTVVVRSHSRIGKGDLGANAKRIEKFQAEMAKRIPPVG